MTALEPSTDAISMTTNEASTQVSAVTPPRDPEPKAARRDIITTKVLLHFLLTMGRLNSH